MSSTSAETRRLAHALVVTGFDGTTVPEWLARRVDDGLGGVCWFAHNVADADQAAKLAEALHDLRDGDDRVLVMSDEEGGDVTRLEAGTGSSWPGHAALGALDDDTATRQVAMAMGRQLRAAGVDVALAPVVDVNSDPDNPVIGVRSFGATSELVSRHATAFVEGLQSAGVAACAKHYPGHGATVTDSHLSLPRVDDPVEVLLARDLAPFRAAVEAGARCVMTAHVVFSAYDAAPATLSPVLLGLLRDHLGFGGVIVTDALDMKAISDGVGHGEGAVLALAAGADLVCIGNPNFPEVYDAETRLDVVVDAIVDAVTSGRLPIQRLEESVARVADLAAWLRTRPPLVELPVTAIGREVAARAVTHRGDVRVDAPAIVDLGGRVNIAAGDRDRHLREVLLRRDPGAGIVGLDELDGLGERPLVVLARDVRGGALHDLLSRRPDAVVVYAGVDTEVPGQRVVLTHGGGLAVAEAAADLVIGP